MTRLGKYLVSPGWLLCAGIAFARDPLEFRLTPAVRQYCQLVRFAQGWRSPISGELGVNWEFNYAKDYEFRSVAGRATQVLVAGLIEVGYKAPNVYTLNKYALDLAHPTTSVRAATDAEWQAGAVIPPGRKFTFYFAEV